MTFQYCFDGSIKKVNNLSVSSPRTWGCFHAALGRSMIFTVFPTHVGVFPRRRRRLYVSEVFPTHVGVFPGSFAMPCPDTGLPHARGGVSPFGRRRKLHGKSSPRTWGCFLSQQAAISRYAVFPTHVGVFPSPGAPAHPAPCLPHARGGVSRGKPEPDPETASSPRTWGCFPHSTSAKL